VLLEAGSIINRDEEVKMSSPERQAMTVKAVTTAMNEFCGVQPPPVVEAKSVPEASIQPPAQAKTGPEAMSQPAGTQPQSK
jgi:hypothetical protein